MASRIDLGKPSDDEGSRIEDRRTDDGRPRVC
jgi:hypothetical protein